MKNIKVILGVVLITMMLFNCESENIDSPKEESIEISDIEMERIVESIENNDDELSMDDSRRLDIFSIIFRNPSDQMGRPAINTVFVSTGSKDQFNITTPDNQGAIYQPMFESNLLGLNPGYTTNALGLDAATFTTILATDVLNVSTVGTTTFFDGVNVLTGRALADDVITTELLLIFGGPDGSANSGLTDDHVDTNDKQFLNSFPYLASPW